jgi:hypothetical protein
MEYRRLLRPLPLFLIFLFVAVAVVDLIQELRQVPEPPLEPVGLAIPRFEASEPVIDFRLNRTDPGVTILPIPELAPDQWSPPERQGVWARSAVAELRLELAVGGHRTLFFECLPASGKRPVRTVRLTINGIGCGEVVLVPEWRKYRVSLQQGVVRLGSNRIVLGFPDRDEAAKPGRALLIRRLGLFRDKETDVSALEATRAVLLDVDAEKVTVRRSGTLEIPLVLDDRTDALQMRYRFPSGAGRADVMVEQSTEEDAGIDDGLRQSVTAAQKASGRIRIPLHGRRGQFMLRIQVDLGTPDSRLLLSSLRLVEEGDPTRRPWAANPRPN